MARVFLSNAKVFLPCPPSTSTAFQAQAPIVCKAGNEGTVVSRRSISVSLTAAATFLFTAALNKANAAILEAEDDQELLEKVKRDRKKRLEKQGVIKSAANETAYLQDLVFKLSKIGQAIEKNDLSTATSVLGSSKDSEWVKKVNSALTKLSSSEEEMTEVGVFNSSLDSLISSVSKNDIEACKVAFVASASAFEKWSALSGLAEQLKGL